MMPHQQQERAAGLQAVSTSYELAHVITLLIFTLLATVAVALRLWARRIQKQALALNDYLIILGLIIAYGETGVNIYGCCFPFQWKKSTQSADETLSRQLAFISPIIWVIAVTIIRASVVFLYIRLFPVRAFRIACYWTLLSNMTFLTATILADCLICRPISYRWDFAIKGASCGDETKLGVFIAICNFLQDVIIIVLPMPILWNLQTAVSRKVALTGMFGMGIAICAVTVYRIQVTATIVNASSPAAKEGYALIALLTSLETLLGIITACLPLLKPIKKKLWRSLPKRGSEANKPSTSGTILVVMRISSMFTSWSQKQSTGERIASPDSWCEIPMQKDGMSHVSVTPKTDQKTENRVLEIPVRSDEDVECLHVVE